MEIKNYPKGYSAGPGGIYYHGEHFSNALIEITDYYEVKFLTSGVTSDTYVEVKFIVEEKNYFATIPYYDLKNAMRFIPRNDVKFVKSESVCNRFLSETIKGAILNKEPRIRYSLDQGYNCFPAEKDSDAHYVFLLGNCIIGDTERIGVDIAPQNEAIAKFKRPLSTQNAEFMPWVSDFLDSDNIPGVLLMAALTPFIMPLIDESQRSRFEFNTYVYGDSGSGKSAITKLLVDYFEGSPNIINLHSNKSEIDKIFEYKHCCVAIDDLCGTDSNRERENNEQKLSENLKRVQTPGQIVRDGKRIKNESMLFVTGEYLLKSSSTLNRCLVVNLKDPIPPKEINKLCRNKDQYLEMVRCFIEWVCKNYDRLSEDLNSKLSDVKNHKNKAERYSGFNRNYAIKSLLFCICDIFCEFIRSVSHDDMTMITRRRSIEAQIDDTLRHLENRSSEYASSRNIVEKAAAAILNSQNVTNDINKFRKAIRLDEDPRYLDEGPHYYDNQLEGSFIISGKELRNIFSSRLSAKSIGEALADENVLMLSKDGSRTYPIRKQGKSQGKWTKKFYHINADALKEYAPCSDETEDKKPEKRESSIFRQHEAFWDKKKKQ
ncbi:hypothetical protein [Ruminococcus sp.]|jgi:hypothetical protein|uniref:hypothetical protein n=1 Tax=Ruminococcus sp. TaxID=41978 RepID=UPI002E777AA2|nr:hypothetical protein [Ruminococcus sp.]MEE0502174.1 hypothetical protein [Ruminococcus sp.]